MITETARVGRAVEALLGNAAMRQRLEAELPEHDTAVKAYVNQVLAFKPPLTQKELRGVKARLKNDLGSQVIVSRR